MLKEALDVYHENIQKTLQELFNRPSTSSANTERSSTKSTAKSPSVDTQSGEKMKELGVPGTTLKEYFPKQFRDGDFGKSN
ncbi:Protein of unknown function [Cotesia congregata]|uniref:Uncharacterized protein n=1 Tax=Cotesia congregata TaxID=51543 RepID=A0A8J2HRF2_COTCN|nr:Protein of unknown function [Cotesia congregata]